MAKKPKGYWTNYRKQKQQKVDDLLKAAGLNPDKFTWQEKNNVSLRKAKGGITQENFPDLFKEKTKKEKAPKDMRKRKNRYRRQQAFEKAGLDITLYTNKQIDSVKLRDIDNGRFTRKNYPEIFKKKGFDFDEIIPLPPDMNFIAALKEFTGEKVVDGSKYRRRAYGADYLLDDIDRALNTPINYKGKKANRRSSNSASEGFGASFYFTYGEAEDLTEIVKNRDSLLDLTNKKDLRGRITAIGKAPEYDYYLNPNYSPVFSEVSGTELLACMSYFAQYLVEEERERMFREMYEYIKEVYPELYDRLPKRRIPWGHK